MEQKKARAIPCEDYEPTCVRKALIDALEYVGADELLKPGMRIGIKLNLCAAMKPERAATTHPVMAAELTRLLLERGAASVVAGDSPGEPFTAAVMNRVYAVTGMKAVEDAGGELNRDWSHRTVEFPRGETAKSYERTSWLDSCDAVISFSKLKSHGLMGMTAAVKNLYGVVPGTMKSEYHFRYSEPMTFANLIVDLNESVKPVFCLCDAVEAMEGNGPTSGTPRYVGALLAGVSSYETDRLAAAILGIREEEVLCLTAAVRRGLLPESAGDIYQDDAERWKVSDFKRSGATSGWFASSPSDSPVKKVMKKALYVLLRSKPVRGAGCTGCGHCANLCPAKAIEIRDGKAVIHRDKCVRCFCCQEFCPTGAMYVKRSVIARLLEK